MGSRCGICGRKQLEERRKAKEEKSKKCSMVSAIRDE